MSAIYFLKVNDGDYDMIENYSNLDISVEEDSEAKLSQAVNDSAKVTTAKSIQQRQRRERA